MIEEISFDAAGRPILVVEPTVYDEPEPEEHAADKAAALALDRRQIVCALLTLLTDATDARGAGQRAFVLAHELKAGTCRRKKDLAAKLGVSPGRVSQVLKSVRRAIHRLA